MKLHFFHFPPVPEPVIEEPGCVTDGDCPSKHACFDGECLNPCLHVRPCAPNADCEVKDELPLRVMVCTCRPGYSGRGDERCELIRKIWFSFIIWERRNNQVFTFHVQESLLTLGAVQIGNVHHLGHAKTGDALTHVQRQIHAVLKPFVRQMITGPYVRAQPE